MADEHALADEPALADEQALPEASARRAERSSERPPQVLAKFISRRVVIRPPAEMS